MSRRALTQLAKTAKTAVALAALLWSAVVLAAANGAASAAHALVEGRFEAACKSLTLLPDTPDGWFVQGRCAAIVGSHADAVRWFEQILTIADAPRTRLELGRSMAALGRRDDAARQLMLVLRSALPEPIRVSVSAELAAFEQPSGRQPVRWRAGMGGLYDTNVNVGPADANVTIFGLPFRLNDRALGTADSGLNTWVGVESQEMTPWGALQLSARIDGTEYKEQKSLSYLTLAAQSSLRREFARVAMTWTVGAQSARQRGGGGRDALYAASSAATALSDDLEGSITLNIGSSQHHVGTPASSRPSTLEIGLRRVQPDGSFMTTGLRMARELFKNDDQSHDDLGVFFSGGGPFSGLCTGCTWSASSKLSQVRYQADDPIFQMRRQDRLADFVFALAFPSGSGSRPGADGLWRLSVDSSVNLSNLPTQRYRRTRLQLSKEMTF